MRVYADNAAMKPLLPEVKEVIREFLDADIRNQSAVYADGRKTKRLIEEARHTVARAIGADPDEIYFTSGASEGINWFAHNADRIYTTTIEHKAVLRNANEFIPVSDTGRVDLNIFREQCPRYGNVIVGWVNNEIGVIQPVKEIVDICHKKHSSILVDATQTIGHIPINVHELGIDFLVGSFGKLGGLTGSGFLYMRKGMHLEPMIKGGGQEHGMRASTENIIGILAGAKAIEIATSHITPNTIRRDYIIENLLQIPKSHLNGSWVRRVDNNINIAFEGIEAESLVLQCDICGLQISAGSACNSASIEPSHVLKAIGLSDNLARASIRITIGDDITDEEVEFIIKTVMDCVAKLRSMSPAWKEIENEDN
jgi:cysteine desulfurase